MAMGLEKLSEKVYTWCRYSLTLGYNLNGYYLDSEEGDLLVDPPELTFDELDEVETIGAPQSVLITNHTHWRATSQHLERWPVPVLMHALDGGRVPRVDRTVTEGERLPGGWRIVHVPGKTLGEVALHHPGDGGVLLVGDTLIGDPPGAVRLVPDQKLESKDRLMESLRKIAALEFDTLLVGDGHSILHAASDTVRRFIRDTVPGAAA
jgi:glyoxylase-like metal-dependent hydrolase (beta-lactamase superfamily II)